MHCLVYEQLEPVPVRYFVSGDRTMTEYAASMRIVRRIDNVRWKGLAWEEAKKLVRFPVLEFVEDENDAKRETR